MKRSLISSLLHAFLHSLKNIPRKSYYDGILEQSQVSNALEGSAGNQLQNNSEQFITIFHCHNTDRVLSGYTHTIAYLYC